MGGKVPQSLMPNIVLNGQLVLKVCTVAFGQLCESVRRIGNRQ